MYVNVLGNRMNVDVLVEGALTFVKYSPKKKSMEYDTNAPVIAQKSKESRRKKIRKMVENKTESSLLNYITFLHSQMNHNERSLAFSGLFLSLAQHSSLMYRRLYPLSPPLASR